MSNELDQPRQLDYETPKGGASAWRIALIVVLAVVFALVGAILSSLGMVGIVSIVQRYEILHGNDLFWIVLCNLFGWVCLLYGVRWMRSALGFHNPSRASRSRERE